MKLTNVLKDSNYKLTQFASRQIERLENSLIVKDNKGLDVSYYICLVRNKEIKLTPEEAVRQLYL